MLLEMKIEAIPISVDGHDYYAVPKAALEAMFRPSLPAAAAKPKAKPGPKPKARAKETAKQPVEPASEGEQQPSVADRVRAALAKRPMASGELITALGCHASSVYLALANMRKAGTVKTEKDHDDGYLTKNYLVA